MGSEPQQERRKKWAGCWGGLPCFGVHKRGKRIVPATRAPDGSNTVANQANGLQAIANQPASIPPHLLAPPSSPASFSNSALQSTAQSPLSHLSMSATSPPGGPVSTMFATGPYAHEMQLVTPPDFSTFTTEPSTAPFTPPPELTHLTTPSSPDVPYAHFLSSAAHLKTTYPPLSPESPASSLRSPVSGDCSPFPKSTKHSRTASGQLTENGGKSQPSNFFCPATFAQYYLDQPNSGGGRLSISKESDSGPVNQSKSTKQEVEELEAYRASFGFSADEIITTTHYVEISDVTDDSFSMVPCTSDKPQVEEATLLGWGRGGSRKFEHNSPGERSARSGSDLSGKGRKGVISPKQPGDESNEQPGNGLVYSTACNLSLTDEEDIYSNMGKFKNSRNLNMGLSCSDAEIEYRRGRSLRECRKDLTWL